MQWCQTHQEAKSDGKLTEPDICWICALYLLTALRNVVSLELVLNSPLLNFWTAWTTALESVNI